MVGLLVALNVGELSAAAKKSEQIMAIAGLVVTAIIVGGVLFVWIRSREERDPYLTRRVQAAGNRSLSLDRGRVAGAVVGGLMGFVVAVMSLFVNQSASAGPLVSTIWIVLIFGLWGAMSGWAYERLSALAGPSVLGSSAGADATLEQIDRRRFLVRLGGATALITVAGAALARLVPGSHAAVTSHMAGLEPWSSTNPLPNADAVVLPVKGTRPELTPVDDHYRIDINTLPPVLRADWRLRIDGLAARPMDLTFADLQNNYPPLHQFVTLACISNPIAGDLTSTTRWTGVSLRSLIEQVGPQPNATHVNIRSADGFHEAVPLDAIMADERIMLTYAWDGLPLQTSHGFPLRIYLPDRYGMKQPKWIEHIELIDHEEPGYWVRRGWDAVARMNATSVIDTIGVDMMVVSADESMLIPIGGISHAGARGISRVEVQVDDGAWQPAQLRDPLSPTTWVIWRYDWPFQAGEHTFTVRCFEGDGTPQVAQRAPVRPSGATGLHSENEML
jgi:DMSO/TMAO reductase YedYZ molybdopterin-dependent catalytic subunit